MYNVGVDYRLNMKVTVKFRPAELDAIGAAESVRVNSWLLDEGFTTRLRYLKEKGWSYRRIALLTGHHWSAVACWARGDYLPRDAQARMLIYQVYNRVRQMENQEIEAVIK